MDNEIKIVATRKELVAAFEKWDAQAKAEGWPAEQDAGASADHLIALVNELQN